MVVKRIVVDTIVVIEALRGNVDVIENLQNYETLFLPSIVCGELYFGAINSSDADRHIKKYNDYLKTCVVLPVTETVGVFYGEIRLALRKIGKPIPENDIWIAAICLANDIPLLSNDNHFSYVDNLKLIILNQS